MPAFEAKGAAHAIVCNPDLDREVLFFEAGPKHGVSISSDPQCPLQSVQYKCKFHGCITVPLNYPCYDEGITLGFEASMGWSQMWLALYHQPGSSFTAHPSRPAPIGKRTAQLAHRHKWKLEIKPL